MQRVKYLAASSLRRVPDSRSGSECTAAPDDKDMGLMHTTARRIATAMAAAACAASVGTAAAAPPTFRTADGTVVCFFDKPGSPRYVHCDWSDRDDIAAEVRVRGRAKLVPAGGAIDPTGVPVLRRGKTKRAGRLQCSARLYGMRCMSLTSGRGFRVGPRIEPQLFAAGNRCPTRPVSAGVFAVRAKGVPCARARRVARTYYRTREVPGWRCRERQLDLEHFRVRCTRGDALVRFAHGS